LQFKKLFITYNACSYPDRAPLFRGLYLLPEHLFLGQHLVNTCLKITPYFPGNPFVDFFTEMLIITSEKGVPMVSLRTPVPPQFYLEGVVSYARPGSSPGFGTKYLNFILVISWVWRCDPDP